MIQNIGDTLYRFYFFILFVVGWLLVGCAGWRGQRAATATREAAGAEAVLALPALEAADLGDGGLEAVATTSIIADVVGHVGGDAIELTTLMGPGQDPHSYEPAVSDLTAVAGADVVFVNGWDLEEGLADDLANISGSAPFVPVNAGVEPLAAAAEDGHDEHEDELDEAHSDKDPHTWLDPHVVRQWVANIEATLSALDPARTELYQENGAAYLAELDALIAYYDEQVARIPEARRRLVTTHSTLTYFAERYGFEVVGTVIPTASTVAEPSAGGLAQLAEEMEKAGACTIFTETTTSDQLARALAGELEQCESVEMLILYTDALGPEGSGAESYLGMMRLNIETIVEGLG